MLKKFALLGIFAVAFVFCAAGNVFAQGEVNFYTPVDTVTYNVYTYPSGTSHFYLPNRFETEFEIANGKFFYIEYNNFVGETDCNFDVYFFAPNGERMAKMKVSNTSQAFSIPHKNNTLAADTLTVKIVNNAKGNKDFKMVVLSPKNAVMGVPGPKAKLLYDPNATSVNE